MVPAAILSLVCLAGCAGLFGPRTSEPHRSVAGRSAEGRDIEVWSLGSGPETVLLISTIHGNENRGTPLLHRMADLLTANPELLEGKRVVIVPVANPDGYAVPQRTNVNGVDLNRNFPALNRENSPRYGMSALSEPEAGVLFAIVHRFQPDRIVSLHEPLECIDWDGPGAEIAAHMGMYCDLPVERIGSRPGSLGSYAGETLGIPIITYEFPRNARKQSDDELWVTYGRSLLAGVTWPAEPPQVPQGD